MTKAMLTMIMKELVAITIVTITMIRYRRNSTVWDKNKTKQNKNKTKACLEIVFIINVTNTNWRY